MGGQKTDDFSEVERNGSVGDVIPSWADTFIMAGHSFNRDGTVTLYHGTTTDAAKQIVASGKMLSHGEQSVYFTTDRSSVSTGYGSVSLEIRLNPKHLSIDDEFRNGRIDFSAPIKNGTYTPIAIVRIITLLNLPPRGRREDKKCER